MIDNRLLAEVEAHIDNFKNRSLELGDGVDFNLHDKIKQITNYSMSKYIGETKDEFGNELRFRNIGNAIVDLEWRAKNLDRKNIEYIAKDGDSTFSMVVNKEIQQYMQDNDWGKFIDDFQYKKSQYGEVGVIDMPDGIDIVNWNYISVNPADLNGGHKVVHHDMSPIEVRKKGWDGEVEAALEEFTKTKDVWDHMKILDIEGEFPLDYFEETDDMSKTVIKNLIWADVNGKKFPLYSKTLTKSRFLFFSRKKIEGRDFGVGVWEEVTEPQIAVNQSVIAEQEALTLSGKVVMKTNKKDLPDAANIVNGEMIFLQDQEYIEALQMGPSGGLAQYQNNINNWFENMQRDQSAFNAVTGEEQKAGTPFASLALQANNAGSIFNKRRDDDGYNLIDILDYMVWPKLIKEVNKEHELTASYSKKELEKIDEAISDGKMNDMEKAAILTGNIVTEESKLAAESIVKKDLEKGGEHRKLKIPKGYLTLEKIMKKTRCDVTDEQSDNQRRLNGLAEQLALLAPGEPQRHDLINEMMEIRGLSPATFGPAAQPSQGAPKVAKSTGTERTIEQALPEGQQ